MPKQKQNGRRTNGRVRRPDIDVNTPWEEMSPLGRELVKISAEAEAAGENFPTQKALEKELERRRTGNRP